MRTGYLDRATGRWVDTEPPHEIGIPPEAIDRVVEEGDDGLVRPVETAPEVTPSLADRARAIKDQFQLNNYAPPVNDAGPVTPESMAWAQRPDVVRSNAGARLEGGNGTYEDRAAVGLPVPESQDHADAMGFARFAGLGAAGELAAPAVGRGISAVADRARAMRAVRMPTDPSVLSPVEMGPPMVPEHLRDQGEAMWRVPGGTVRPRSDSTRMLTEPNFSTEGLAPRTVSADRGYVPVRPEDQIPVTGD